MSFIPRRFRRSTLEHDLRAARPEPSSLFVQTLEHRARRDGASPRRGGARIAVAGVLTAALLALLAAFGGMSYAATGAADAVSAAGRIVHLHFAPHTVGNVSSAADQYNKVKLCHNGHEIEVDENAVPAHLAHGDTFGDCPTFAPTITGSAGNDKIDDSDSTKNLKVVDTKGNNTIKTGKGDDVVTTGAGNDKINVGAGNNKVNSGAGDDTITAGKGHNTIFSGEGNDTIFVQNGFSDFVNCGPGVDTVFADSTKIDFVAKNCEIVHRKGK